MQTSLSSMAAGLEEALANFAPNDISLGLDETAYTMASERENHLRVTGGEAAAVTEQQSGVELF